MQTSNTCGNYLILFKWQIIYCYLVVSNLQITPMIDVTSRQVQVCTYTFIFPFIKKTFFMMVQQCAFSCSSYALGLFRALKLCFHIRITKTKKLN